MYCLAIYILILPKGALEENADLVERKSGASPPLPSRGIRRETTILSKLSENDVHPLWT